jgi:DNA-binding transcriptional MerR regulator
LTLSLGFTNMTGGRFFGAPKEFMPKGPRSSAGRAGHTPSAQVIIPDRLYFRIGDACELIGIKAHVLRYWESEFSMLKPIKDKAGRRLYRRQDLETAIEIKRLLYEKGYTIDGARKLLAGPAPPDASAPSGAPSPHKTRPESAVDSRHLSAIKRELQGILTILSSKC